MNKKPTNESEYVNQTDAARILGVHLNTMVALAKRPDGPPRTKLGPRLVRYSKTQLLAWMESKQEAA